MAGQLSPVFTPVGFLIMGSPVGVVDGGGPVRHDHCCGPLIVKGDGGVVGVDPTVVLLADREQVRHVCPAAVVPVSDVMAVTVTDRHVTRTMETSGVHRHDCCSLGAGVVALVSSNIEGDPEAVMQNRCQLTVAGHFAGDIHRDV
jgi:hypothetical protein